MIVSPGRLTAAPQSGAPAQTAPVRATVAGSVSRTANPPKVISTAARSSGLPTSRVASRRAAPGVPARRVREPQRRPVEGTRTGHTEIRETLPAEVLHAGQRAGGQH